MTERLHKYLARCGVGSRRACEELMRQGRVAVDGEIVREPGARIDPDTQTVMFNGREVRPERFVYYALHKPPGHVCTSHDPGGRPRAIDLLPEGAGRVYTVGRLDADSEGLILVTNDGDFAHRLSHPRHEVVKTYELTLSGMLTPRQRQEWIAGMDCGGERLKVKAVSQGRESRAGWIHRIELGEGRNRHLRRMAEASGLGVRHLKRTAIGGLVLGALKRGEYRELTPADREKLLHRPSTVRPPVRHRTRTPDR